MTEISRFWTGTSPGDAGAYSADAFNRVWKLLLHAVAPNMGVIIDSASDIYFALRVEATNPASANITVRNGAAMVDGTYYENNALLTIPIPANPLADPRIDTVILRKDWAAQTIRCVLKAGTPAAAPVPPTLTQNAGVLWEIPITDIAVASGFTTITDTNIRSRAQWANAASRVIIPYVLNASGGTLEDGDVVIWSNGSFDAVATTTQAGSKNVAGVWVGRTVNGGSGSVLVKGQYVVNMTGVTVAAGDRIETGSTAKVGRVATGNGNLGRILDNSLANGRPRAYIDVQYRSEDYVLIRDEKTSSTAGGGFTSGAWRTRDLNTEVVDTGNIASISSNQIILEPGIYRVRWRAPAKNVANHKSRLQNVTGGGAGTTLIVGTTEYIGVDGTPANGDSGCSFGEGRMILTVASTLELQHQCSNTVGTVGFGSAAGFSAIEVYSVIEFWKEG